MFSFVADEFYLPCYASTKSYNSEYFFRSADTLTFAGIVSFYGKGFLTFLGVFVMTYVAFSYNELLIL